MDYQLLTDRLTNFYTRDSFFSLFEDQLRRATFKKGKFSILITDINNFKRINDRYGHACGAESDYPLAPNLINQIPPRNLTDRVSDKVRRHQRPTQRIGEGKVILYQRQESGESRVEAPSETKRQEAAG